VTSPSGLALDITIRPVCEGARPEAVDVRVELAAPSEAPVFRIGNAIDAEALEDLIERPTLRDDDGLIELSRRIAPGSDGEARIFFTGERLARGKLALTYRVRAQPTETRGIRFGLRHGDGAIGGSGDGFLILPAMPDARDITVLWDIGHCAFKWQVGSALGLGAGPHRIHAAPDALRQAAFFAGGMHASSFDDGKTHLRLAIIGKVAFDESVALAYAGRVLVAERAAFGDDDPTPFYAFMRVLPEMTTKVVGGGNMYGYSSVVGPAAEWNARMRNHIAHELLHHWIGVGLWVRDADGVSGYWLTEGFTTRYARTIALRAGAISPAEYLAEVNKQAAAFYGNPLRGSTNAVVERAIETGEGDPSLGLLPYYKGSFYADELDGAIRAGSNGKRSLDDVVRGLLAQAKSAPRNEAGYAQLTEDVVRSAIAAELGTAGAKRFDDVVRHGVVPRPGPTALGPCFVRRDKKYGVLDGYEWVRAAGVADERCGELGPSH